MEVGDRVTVRGYKKPSTVTAVDAPFPGCVTVEFDSGYVTFAEPDDCIPTAR